MNGPDLQFIASVATIASFFLAAATTLRLGRRIAAVVILVTLAGLIVALAPASFSAVPMWFQPARSWQHLAIVASAACLFGLWAHAASRIVFILIGLACVTAIAYVIAILVFHGWAAIYHISKEAQMTWLVLFRPWLMHMMAARMEFAIALSALATGVCLDHMVLQLDNRPTHVQL